MFAIGCCVRLRLMVELSLACWSYRGIDARIGSNGMCRVAAMGVEGAVDCVEWFFEGVCSDVSLVVRQTRSSCSRS